MQNQTFEPLSLSVHQSKLGEQANLAGLVGQILSVADGNKDGRVSLPEARSTWALLQMDEVHNDRRRRRLCSLVTPWV